jgi:hypothetical protein
MHGTTLAILAAIAHEFAERENHGAAGDFDFHLWWFLPGYLVAVALHTTFNQFPDKPMVAMMGSIVFAPIALIAIFNFGTAEARRWLEKEKAAHNGDLAALRSGGWPDTPSGRAVAGLAERLGHDKSQRIHRYWEVLAYLVVEAEETMMEEAAGDVEFDRLKVEAAFAEADSIRRSLGKTSYSALQRVLPLSRNDYWEIAELRQRVSKR